MSVSKTNENDRRYTFNHVDIELHSTAHAKSALYAMQNHEEYEMKSLPLNYNNLNFDKVVNQQLVESLYLEKRNTTHLSKEFKSNLIYFYIYYTLYIGTILGLNTLLYYEGSINSSHYQIHIVCNSILIVFAYTILILLRHQWVLIRVRECFLTLGFFSYIYFILADSKSLYTFTGETYNPNEIPLIIGLLTLGPMLKIILFDSFLYILITGLSASIIFLCVRLPFTPDSRYTALSEISLTVIFIMIQIIETHRVDLRIKHIFWRREKEIIMKKEKNSEIGLKSLGINSDVEIIIDMCDQINKKLKDIGKVIMYKDIKIVLKESVAFIEKIKWKIAHNKDVKVIIDSNIDDDDREYIEQNCLEIKKGSKEKSDKNGKIEKKLSDISEIISKKVSGRFSYQDVEGAIATFGINWNFDIWFVFESTGESISLVASHILSKWNLYDLFKVSRDSSQRYFENIQNAYKANPYHNSCHAADVLHSFMFFVLSSHLFNMLTPLEIFSSIIAILGHDVAHPGVTNRYLINNKDDLALQFNDSSVLENMHCATIYGMMRKAGSDILSSLSQEDWFRVRGLIIQMVLATDMSRHFELLGQFRARVLGLKDLEVNNYEDRTLIMNIGLKCADLGHSAKITELHKKWSFLVCDELFTQGDLEKEKFQAVSMYCDRDITDIDKSQSGFIKNICMPLYEVWGVYLNSQVVQKNCINQQVENQKYWEDRAKYRKSTLHGSIITEAGVSSSHWKY